MAQAARLASRLQRELRMLHSDPPPGVSAWPLHDHLLTHLQAQIDGPQGTVYANGFFKLDIQVPERYPFEPPNIKFVTPVYHPNIDNGGRICLDILNLPPKGAWRPSLNISTLLASIGLLLAEPNPDDGLMGEITAEYKHDRLSFDIKARRWTELYARQDQVTAELNEPKTSSNTESNQNSTTLGVHGQEAENSNGEHVISTCGVLSQPPKSGLSLSKRLALDRGTACLQQNKAASSISSQGKMNQVLCANAFNQLGSEGTGLQAKVCKNQSLKELVIIEEQSKSDFASATCNVTSLDKKKVPSHVENKVESLSRDSSKGLFNEMAAGSSNSALDAAIADAASLERSAEVGKVPQLHGSFSPSVSISAKVLRTDLGNDSGCWNKPVSRKRVQDCKERSAEVGKGPQLDGSCSPSVSVIVKMPSNDLSNESKPISRKRVQGSIDFVSVNKENRPPRHCPATKSNVAISSHLAAEKEMAEIKPMEVPSGNINSSSTSTCINSLQDLGGKERGHLSLPSRTKSLKLARAKLDSQPFNATTMQKTTQSISIEKKRTSPIIIPDDIPTVVVSDSGSDSELSDEGFTLSLTQRGLINKRKAGSKLR